MLSFRRLLAREVMALLQGIHSQNIMNIEIHIVKISTRNQLRIIALLFGVLSTLAATLFGICALQTPLLSGSEGAPWYIVCTGYIGIPAGPMCALLALYFWIILFMAVFNKQFLECLSDDAFITDADSMEVHYRGWKADLFITDAGSLGITVEKDGDEASFVDAFFKHTPEGIETSIT